MANNDAPHGFKPYEELLHAGLYCVATAPTINIMVGDMVGFSNTSIACTKGRGQMASVEDGQVISTTPGAAYAIMGAVLACFDENMFPVNYIAAAEAGDGTVAGYVLIADHPYQLFEAQEDGETAAIAAADVGLNFEIASPALSAGNTTTGISKQEIDSDSHSTTATMALRVIKMAYPEEDTIGSAGCRWVVQISPLAHFRGYGTAI